MEWQILVLDKALPGIITSIIQSTDTEINGFRVHIHAHERTPSEVLQFVLEGIHYLQEIPLQTKSY